MYLEELIENVQLESERVECKAVLNRDDTLGWLKSVAGFANASGGDLFIGVEDKSYKLIGFDRKDADDERNYFNNLRDFYSEHNGGRKLSEKALRSLGFVNEEGYLLNGAVLFMDDYKDKKTEVQCSVFSGYNKGSERIVTINRFNGNITSTINYILSFVNQRMNHSIIKQGEGRINIDSFPARALFEGVVNAVAHRDYYLDGTQIQVDIFRDRLEISSPGGFYRGEKLGKTYNLSGIISKRRNELIAGVLVMCNVMEAAGTGFEKIMEEYAEADEAHKPYIYSASDHFTLVLPDMTYEKGVEDEKIPQLVFAPIPNGTDLDEKIISFCFMKAHKVSEIAEYLGISDSTYLRKQVLGNLEENGYLEKSRMSGAMFYKTKKDMVTIE